MLFYNMPPSEGANFTLAEANIYRNVAIKTWNGTADPANTYPGECVAYRNQAGDYITWLTRQYQLYMAKRI